jgi:hypothetical protein
LIRKEIEFKIVCCQALNRCILPLYRDMGARKADRLRVNKRKAGLAGAKARAAALSPERRREIASKAARAAMVIVRRHPVTHLPTCLLLPEGVTPYFDGPRVNAALVSRTWLARERQRMRAILLSPGFCTAPDPDV